MASNNLPFPSAEIEWEDARPSAAARPLRMPGAPAAWLLAEARGTLREVDVLLLHDPEAVPGPAIEGMVDRALPRGRWPARSRIAASGDLRCYEQKDRGMSGTSGEVVVLPDSDVVPEAGRPRRLPSAFEDPAVGVVRGGTHVGCASLHDRALALFRPFPPRTGTAAARPQRFSELARYSLGTFRERMRQATSRIARGHRAVDLSRAGAVGAWGLALAYNTLYLAGQLLSRVSPTTVPRYFPIR